MGPPSVGIADTGSHDELELAELRRPEARLSDVAGLAQLFLRTSRITRAAALGRAAIASCCYITVHNGSYGTIATAVQS